MDNPRAKQALNALEAASQLSLEDGDHIAVAQVYAMLALAEELEALRATLDRELGKLRVAVRSRTS